VSSHIEILVVISGGILSDNRKKKGLREEHYWIEELQGFKNG
jgi:hypothetical protein